MTPLEARLAVLKRWHDHADKRFKESGNAFGMAMDAAIKCVLLVMIQATEAEIKASKE